MSILSMLLILSAIFISIVVIGLLIIWMKGINSFLFPGAGVLVATPAIVLLSLIVEFFLVLLAMLTKQRA